MRANLEPLVSMVLAAAAAGCGARTSLDASDAPAAPAKVCSTWSVDPGDPIELSEGDVSILRGLFAEGDRVFVGITDSSGTPEHAGVRVMSDDLSFIGPIKPVIQKGFMTGMASGFGHRAAIGIGPGSGAGGNCTFASLADDGSTGSTVTSVDVNCGQLIATPSGYAALGISWMNEPGMVSLFFLDPEGTLVGGKGIAHGQPGGLLRFDDGSFLLHRHNGSQTWIQHVSETGDALADAVELPEPLSDGLSFGSTALLVWREWPNIVLRSIDEDGATIATNVMDAGVDAALGVNLVQTKQGPLVFWTLTGFTQASSHLYVQPVTPTGALDGDLLVVPHAGTFGATGVGTAHGALILYPTERSGGCGEHSCTTTFHVMARSLCHE